MSPAPVTPIPAGAGDRTALARRLAEVRQRTLALIEPLDPAVLGRQILPILSPIAWDLGHIANFEELWLVQQVTRPRSDARLDRVYDAITNPRPTRPDLPIPEGEALFRYLHRVRTEALDVLERLPFDESPLLRDAFVYELVAEHEEQHQETILQALQALTGPPYRPPRRRPPAPGRPLEAEMIPIPGGSCRLGAAEEGFAYDNERPAHPVEVPTFWIDAGPVTNGDYLAFVEERGYDRRQWWSEAGWAWRVKSEVQAPGYWTRVGPRWHRRRLDTVEPLVPREPVSHVSFHEAEAYARFVNKRLPTEAEWEKAATWDPAARRARRYPWGDAPPGPEHANLDHWTFGPAEVGAYPAGRSFFGVQQMVGDLWEWTASDFQAYPGFRAFPYREYSEVFYGDRYKVLRGGSWATRPAVARATFRNWDFPQRRQLFAGFRCARDE